MNNSDSNEKSLILEGMKYLIDFFNTLNKGMESVKEHSAYHSPLYIFRGISKFYPHNSQEAIEKAEIDIVEKDTIRSGLSVRLSKSATSNISDATIRANYINALRNMLVYARKQFPEKYIESMSDLDILADIQHNGGATCLVDFSKNVLTALWFACKDEDNSNGFVYCYDIMHDIIVNDNLKMIKKLEEMMPIETLLAQTYRETNISSDVDIRFCIWEPTPRNNRIIRQDSVFVFGMEVFKAKEHGVQVIKIDADRKRAIIVAMKAIFNISENTIFNDYIGFANANNKYNKLHNLHRDVYDKGFEDMIEGNFESALKFFNLYQATYKYPIPLEKQVEIHFSLAVCYKNLKRKNNSISYERNVIIEYKKVINIVKRLLNSGNSLDSETKSYYIRKCSRAYNGIFDMLYNLEDYREAISICDNLIYDIENGILKERDTLPGNKDFSPKYCRITKLELINLFLMNQNVGMDKNELSKWSSVFENTKNKTTIDTTFDKLLCIYYSLVFEILITNEMSGLKTKFLRKISDLKNCMKEQKVDEGYVLWNFTDIKNSIEKNTNGINSYKRRLLSFATAHIIAYRDELEVNRKKSV